MKRTNTVNAPRALDIKGQPHQLSYITAEEAEVLKTRGGSGKPGPMGIPSFFIDDDDEEAELSEAITGSYTGSDGSQQTGFTFDDGGDNGVNYTLGKSDPRGGTEIKGNVIRGGKIFGRTQSQLDRQQRLAGMGDYRNSEAYQRYKTETGRSLQNPYGNTGLFSGIFGADRVNYNMDPAQAQNILDIGFDRYMNFDQQPESAQRRGFGQLFGGPEGEMTAQGEIREQIQPMSTSDMAARLVAAAGGLGAPLAMLPGRNVGYTPMDSSGYDPQLDPQVNPDLKSGPFSLLTGGVNIPEAFGRAKDFITSKLSPAEELAAQTQTQTRGPELSQTVSGGRFEDDSAKNRAPTQGPPELFVTDRSSVRTFDPSAPNVPVEAISGTVDFPGTIFDKDFDNVLVAKGTTMIPSQFQKAQDFKREQDLLNSIGVEEANPAAFGRGNQLRDNPALVSDASDLLPNVFEIMQQNEFLNNLLEDGTLYETEGGKKFRLDMEDGNPQLKLSIPFSTA